MSKIALIADRANNDYQRKRIAKITACLESNGYEVRFMDPAAMPEFPRSFEAAISNLDSTNSVVLTSGYEGLAAHIAEQAMGKNMPMVVYWTTYDNVRTGDFASVGAKTVFYKHEAHIGDIDGAKLLAAIHRASKIAAQPAVGDATARITTRRESDSPFRS